MKLLIFLLPILFVTPGLAFAEYEYYHEYLEEYVEPRLDKNLDDWRYYYDIRETMAHYLFYPSIACERIIIDNQTSSFVLIRIESIDEEPRFEVSKNRPVQCVRMEEPNDPEMLSDRVLHSPLQQAKLGYAYTDVLCRDDYISVTNLRMNSVCVFEESVMKLFERGYLKAVITEQKD